MACASRATKRLLLAFVLPATLPPAARAQENLVAVTVEGGGALVQLRGEARERVPLGTRPQPGQSFRVGGNHDPRGRVVAWLRLGA